MLNDVCRNCKCVMTAVLCMYRWWPSEVVQPEDIPDNILPKKPGDCMFVVRFCGSRDFCWTYHGRVIPYIDGSELEGIKSHHKKSKSSDNYKKGENYFFCKWCNAACGCNPLAGLCTLRQCSVCRLLCLSFYYIHNAYRNIPVLSFLWLP